MAEVANAETLIPKGTTAKSTERAECEAHVTPTAQLGVDLAKMYVMSDGEEEGIPPQNIYNK